FNGIPSPVASPAEDGISPVCAEKNSDGEKSPGDHGPAAGGGDPFLAGGLHDQRAGGEPEGKGETKKSGTEQGGRENNHRELQERVESAAVGTHRTFKKTEGIGGEVHQGEKENLHARENHRRIGEEAWIGFVAKAEDETVSGE